MIRSFATIFLLLSAAMVCAGPSVTERYFGGLRQRGLFDLAEGEAFRRLSQPRIPLDQQATLIAELARTFSGHAKYTTGREQVDLWERSERLISDFLAEHPDFKQRIQLEVLDAELKLSRVETLRWLAELAPEQSQNRTEAKSLLDSTIQSLAKSEESLRRRLSSRLRRRTERTEPLSPTELNELLATTRLLLGTAELEAARLADGETRNDHLVSAEKWLSDIARGAAANDETWQAQIRLAEAARIAGKYDVVRRRLAAFEPSLLSDAAKDASAAVSAKLLIDEGKPDRAVTFLIDYRRTRGSLTGELRLIQIRGLAAAAASLAKNGNEQEAAALRDEIPKIVEWTEAEHGGFWAYRARLAARSVEKNARYGFAVAEHVNRAEAAVISGDLDEAIAAYGEASRLASNDPELAAELAHSRASILLQANRFKDAADAFAEIVTAWPSFEKSPEAHLLSAYALGRLHDEEPSTARREAYIARLEEHRTRFANSPTAAEATLRLARLLEQRRQYSQALQLLPEVVGDAERGDRAAAAIARSYENLLRYLKSSQKSASTPAEAGVRSRQVEEWTSKAVGELLTLTESLRGSGDSVLSAQQAELALRATRLLLERPDGQDAASRLLDRLTEALAIDHPAEEQAFWTAVRRSMLPLRIVALSSEHRFTEADRLLDSLKEAPVGDLFAVVRGLSELTDPAARDGQPVIFGAASGPVGPRLEDLRQVASQMLTDRREELSPTQARQLDLMLARTSLSTGDSTAALDRYEAALAERPKDKGLLLEAASTLLASEDLPAVERSRDYWRRLESLEKAGTEPWFQARMKVIEADLALGDVAEARKLLTVTKLLHPTLGGEETRAIFESLERRVDSKTAATRDHAAR